jgi:hypothetical protein
MPKAKLDPPPPSSQRPRRRTLSDPLAAALLPPPDESPIDREVRLKAEIDAKKLKSMFYFLVNLSLVKARLSNNSS